MPQQHKSKLSFMFGAVVVSLLVLLLCSVPAMADAEEGPCKGLKPFNNIDELLYQFYINLDSDCLFETPAEELEKIWDTKILSFYKNDHVALRNLARRGYDLAKLRKVFSAEQYTGSVDENFVLTPHIFEMKPYNSERDAFYIEVVKSDEFHIESFIIRMTREYEEKEGTLFIDDDYPEGFPTPLKAISGIDYYCHHGNGCSRRSGKYFDNDQYYYYWLSLNETGVILLRGEFGFVRSVEIHRQIPDFLREKNR